MSVFKPFEIEAIKLLAAGQLSDEVLVTVFEFASEVSYHQTGAGYFLTVHHDAIPKERVVCSEPRLIGTSEGVECGFVVFVGDHEFTLECHGWGVELPESYRNGNVALRLAA